MVEREIVFLIFQLLFITVVNFETIIAKETYSERADLIKTGNQHLRQVDI